MAKGKRRLHPINKEEVLRLQRAMGLNTWQLAERAGLDWKTINAWLNGEVEGGLISKVTKLAKALGVTADRIIEGARSNAIVESPETHEFDAKIQVQGSVSDPAQVLALTHAVGRMIENLAANNVEIRAHQTQLALFTAREGELKRIIVLIYGQLENGAPLWVFAAVRPARYPLFQAAYRTGALDIHQFDLYGEIVVSGEGAVPPDDVTLKVAEIYGTNAAELMQAVQEPPTEGEKPDPAPALPPPPGGKADHPSRLAARLDPRGPAPRRHRHR